LGSSINNGGKTAREGGGQGAFKGQRPISKDTKKAENSAKSGGQYRALKKKRDTKPESKAATTKNRPKRCEL
jgi:hypothetical protein